MPDNVSVDNQGNQTEALEVFMEKGMDIYRTLILCANLIFQNDAARYVLFKLSEGAGTAPKSVETPIAVGAGI